MAFDLIFGRTRRDWSCGSLLDFPTHKRRQELAQDAIASSEAGKLGPVVENEFRQTFAAASALINSGRMPSPDRKTFRILLQRWQTFSLPRDGKYTGDDYVALTNFREANRRMSRKIASLSAAPIAHPPTPATTPSTPPPESSPPKTAAPRISKLGLGLAALFTLGYLYDRSLRRAPHADHL